MKRIEKKPKTKARIAIIRAISFGFWFDRSVSSACIIAVFELKGGPEFILSPKNTRSFR
jgi:hypothetical protein